MSYKSDIQATRSTAVPSATAIIAPPIRLRAISVASDGGWSRCFRIINYI
jgi:hypothetical protein